MYVAKFPLHVMEKTRAAATYNSKSRYSKAYGYLDLDKDNRLQLYFSLVSRKDSLRINVAKHYLYDTLLLNLMYRPIPRPRTVDDKLWLHPDAKKLRTERRFNQMPPDQIHKVFEHSLEKMGNLVTNLTGKQQIKARAQFDRLVEVQWKEDLLYTLWEAEKFEEKNNY